MVTANAPQIIIPSTRPKEDKSFWETIERNIRLGIGRRKVLMEQRQREIARYEQMIPRKTVDGLGQLTAVIDMETYLMWDQVERGCWSNKKFGRNFIKHNPHVRASRPDKKYI